MPRAQTLITDKKGNEKKGDAEAEFDASGYGPGCDPNNLPGISAAQRTEKKASRSPPRASSQPEKPPEKATEGKAPDSEPTAPDDGDEGVVAPPSKRPGYAQ